MLTIKATIPLVRIFDEAKDKVYYCDWLGFSIDWEHRFEPGMPLYMQVSLGNLKTSSHRTPWRLYAWKQRVYITFGTSGILCVNHR